MPNMLYNISMYGRTYTLDDYDITRDGKVIAKRNGKALKPQPNSKGYQRVCIGKKKYFVHRLVAEKYVPNPNGKPQVNHINGDKWDNRAENLEWVTNAENRAHAVKNGLQIHGSACPWAKLTEDDVRYIRSSEENIHSIAERLGVTAHYVGAIRRGVGWKSVEKVC